MTERKGLSQILYLIIAASVLMMVALSLIFMFNDSIGGGTGDTQACLTAIETQCTASGATSISPPPNCITEASGSPEVISGVPNSRVTGTGNNADISCNTGGGTGGPPTPPSGP